MREVSLDEPIRYSPQDPIERWLNDLLCLDATSEIDELPLILSEIKEGMSFVNERMNELTQRLKREKNYIVVETPVLWA